VIVLIFVIACPGMSKAAEDNTEANPNAKYAKAAGWGRGPKGEETCPDMKCEKWASAEFRVCGGICRQYYPQIRFFFKNYLPKYDSKVLWESQTDGGAGLNPSLHFFNKAGVEKEKVEINGMYDHEIVEELEKRGIHPKESLGI